jgi:hypothetical protein
MENKIGNFRLRGEIGEFVCYSSITDNIMKILVLFETMRREGYDYVGRIDSSRYLFKKRHLKEKK